MYSNNYFYSLLVTREKNSTWKVPTKYQVLFGQVQVQVL